MESLMLTLGSDGRTLPQGLLWHCEWICCVTAFQVKPGCKSSMSISALLSVFTAGSKLAAGLPREVAT